jgi:hypothetical protein
VPVFQKESIPLCGNSQAKELPLLSGSVIKIVTLNFQNRSRYGAAIIWIKGRKSRDNFFDLFPRKGLDRGLTL